MNRFQVRTERAWFDIEKCCSAGQVFRWREVDPGRWMGLDGPIWYLARVTQVGDELVLDIESNAEESDFRSLFRLDLDPRLVEDSLVQCDPSLQETLKEVRGLRLMRPSSAAETFVSFLCTPNNHISRISAMVAKLGATGPPAKGADRLEPNLAILATEFPSLKAIADLPESALRSLGFGYRAQTIPFACGVVLDAGGEDWLIGLRSAPYEDVFESLLAIKGIGPKLADCIALFACHKTEATPIDVHMWRTVARRYFPQWKESPLTGLKYREATAFLRDKFGKWAGWAHHALYFEEMKNSRNPAKNGQISNRRVGDLQR